MTDIEDTILSNPYLQQFFVWRTETNDTLAPDGDIMYMDMPGNFDLTALINEDNIVIIDKTVYKFFDNIVVSVPATQYQYIAEYEDETTLRDLIVSGAIENAEGEPIQCYTSNITTRRLTSYGISTPTHFEDASDPYKTTLDIKSYDTFPWFGGTRRRNEVTIKNYVCRYSCEANGVGYSCSYDHSHYISTKLRTRLYNIYFNACSFNPDISVNSHWYLKIKNKKSWTMRNSYKYYTWERNRNANIIIANTQLNVSTEVSNAIRTTITY